MALSQEVQDAGHAVASATEATLPEILNRVLRRFLGWPSRVTSACVVDRDGSKTETFASVVYAVSERAAAPEPNAIPANAAAAVVDACENLDLEKLRAAYRRIAQVKRRKKSGAPRQEGVPRTTVTLGIIFALRSALPLEDIAEELDRLNTQTPGRERPDMVVVSSTGLVDYAAHFPGESLTDYLPPAEGALAAFVPPIYVVTVMRPTGAYTFNKMLAFLIPHLAIFSPGAKLPDRTQILEGVPQQVVPISEYQYNLRGDLLPVPRQFSSDRYLPPLPMRIEDQQGNLLSTLQFLPWQDGGVILLEGKLPLDGLLVFLGKEVLARATIFKRPNAQISCVLPITQASFNGLLTRIQRQTNMVVRHGETKWVVQKFADEGSRSPFMARLFMGIMRLRDAVYPDDARREHFDKSYEFVTSSVLNARTTAQEIVQLWEEHVRKVNSGEVARLQGQTTHIDESIDKELRRQVESFLNTAVRALKQGMKDLAAELHLDIGFLFQKQVAFDRGLAALESTDPALAVYLRETRAWSERLLECRNAVEHEGWALPRVRHPHTDSGIRAAEPSISDQPVSKFVTSILDRLNCFVEEFTVHCLQRQMPPGITITEIPLAERLAEAPERFTLTLASGGQPAWQIVFHSSSFEET